MLVIVMAALVFRCTGVGSRASGPKYGESSPLDVSGLPEVVAAQRHHRRLTRRHGELAVAQALRRAENCIEKWRAPIWGAQKLRLDTLLGPDWERVHCHSLAYTASNYPELVSLAGILASPNWRAIAANPATRPQFLAEIGRQRSNWPEHLPYPEPSRGDALHDWIISLQQSAHIRFAEPYSSTAARPI